jgi:hypothetical protein
VGPPATYYLTTAEGEGFAVPVWMTAEAAADVRYEAHPRLDLRALVQIAGLTLPVQVAQSLPERSFGRDELALLVDPNPELIDDGLAVLDASSQSLLGNIARQRRGSLDLEQRGDLA